MAHNTPVTPDEAILKQMYGGPSDHGTDRAELIGGPKNSAVTHDLLVMASGHIDLSDTGPV